MSVVCFDLKYINKFDFQFGCYFHEQKTSLFGPLRSLNSYKSKNTLHLLYYLLHKIKIGSSVQALRCHRRTHNHSGQTYKTHFLLDRKLKIHGPLNPKVLVEHVTLLINLQTFRTVLRRRLLLLEVPSNHIIMEPLLFPIHTLVCYNSFNIIILHKLLSTNSP